jgi:pheromone receptor transcription factor
MFIFTGIMKKAYELSTLTGTQVLLLVVSETGLVYTFTTAKLQPLVTQPEGKNLIQSCLNAPAGQPPSSLPVGATIGRSAPQPTVNAPGGLAINDDDGDDDSDGADREVKRPRRLSNEAGPADAPSAPMGIPNQPQSHGASPGIPPRVSPIQSQNGAPQPGSSIPQQHAQPQPGVRPGQPVPYGAPQTFHPDNMGNSYMPPYNGYYNMQQQPQGMPQGQQYPRQ